MNDRPVRFDGAVLCGGASRRMGTDKALIEVDGTPMAIRVAAALRAAGAVEVAAIGGDLDRLLALGLDGHDDRWPGEGPLGGIIAALRCVGESPAVVVLACDLLDPDPAIVADLVHRRAVTDADAVVPVAAGRPQWVHAVWTRRVVGTLADAFGSGERSIMGVVGGLRTEYVQVDGDARTADADVPDDLAGR